MAAMANLIVNLIANTAAFSAGMKQAQSSVSTLRGTIQSLGSVTGLGGVVGGLGLAHVMQSSIKAAADGEQKFRKLQAVVKATGGASGFSADEMKHFANSLQQTTAFSRGATIGAETLMATFKNVKGANFKSAIKAAQDMSTIMGTDLTQAARLVGRAMNDPTKGVERLARVMGGFDPVMTAQIKSLAKMGDTAGAQALILQGMNEKFGGAAQADLETYSGQVKKLENEFHDLEKRLGEGVLPALKETVAMLDGLLPKTNASSEMVGMADASQKGNKPIDAYQQAFDARRKALIEMRASANALKYDLYNVPGWGTGSNLGYIGRYRERNKLTEAQEAFANADRIMKATDAARTIAMQAAERRGASQGILGLGKIFSRDLVGGVNLLGAGAQTALSYTSPLINKLDIIKQKMRDVIGDRGVNMFEATRNPLERYGKSLSDINSLLTLGAIPGGGETADRARFNLARDAARGLGLDREPQRAGATVLGSVEEYSARMGAIDAAKLTNVKLDTVIDLLKQQKDLEEKQLKNFTESGIVTLTP